MKTKLIWNKIAAVLAFLIGVMAVFAGGQVFLGIIPDYYIIDWLPGYNFVLGLLSASPGSHLDLEEPSPRSSSRYYNFFFTCSGHGHSSKRSTGRSSRPIVLKRRQFGSSFG